MPKKPKSSTHSIEQVLRTIFGSEGNSPVVIDMSDVAKPYTKFELLLTEHQRKSLVEFCSLSKRLKKKLETAGSGRQTVIVTRVCAHQGHGLALRERSEMRLSGAYFAALAA
jgi:hypothetical protein